MDDDILKCILLGNDGINAGTALKNGASETRKVASDQEKKHMNKKIEALKHLQWTIKFRHANSPSKLYFHTLFDEIRKCYNALKILGDSEYTKQKHLFYLNIASMVTTNQRNLTLDLTRDQQTEEIEFFNSSYSEYLEKLMAD